MFAKGLQASSLFCFLVAFATVAAAESKSSANGFLAMSVAAPKVHFLNRDGSPQKAFLVKGDVVLVLRHDKDLVDVSYVNNEGIARIGYLPSKKLNGILPIELKVGQLLGKWKFDRGNCNIGELTFNMASAGGTISAEGLATSWHGAVKDCGPNEGEFGPTDLAAAGGGLIYSQQLTEGDPRKCHVEFKMVSPKLLQVEDTSETGCWGGGVSFTGLYIKKN